METVTAASRDEGRSSGVWRGSDVLAARKEPVTEKTKQQFCNWMLKPSKKTSEMPAVQWGTKATHFFRPSQQSNSPRVQSGLTSVTRSSKSGNAPFSPCPLRVSSQRFKHHLAYLRVQESSVEKHQPKQTQPPSSN